MELPQTLSHRHSTNNRAYGFDQYNQPVEGKATKASFFLPEGDFAYKYSVAGNNHAQN